MKKYKILIGIPYYNEENNLKRLVEDLSNFNFPSNIKIMFLDDGSTDNSLENINFLDHEIRKLPKNYGYGSAVKKIYEHAKSNSFSYFIIFPGDYQRKFEDLNKLLNACNGQDLIVGSKFKLSKIPVFRKIGNYFFSFLLNVFYKSENYSDVLSGFKAYKTSSVDSFIYKLPNRYEFDVCFFYLARRYRFLIEEIDVKANYHKQTSKMPHNIIIMGTLFFTKFFLFVLRINLLEFKKRYLKKKE